VKASGADVARGFLDYGGPLAIAHGQFCGFWFCHIVSFWFEPLARPALPGAGWAFHIVESLSVAVGAAALVSHIVALLYPSLVFFE